MRSTRDGWHRAEPYMPIDGINADSLLSIIVNVLSIHRLGSLWKQTDLQMGDWDVSFESTPVGECRKQDGSGGEVGL